MSLNIIAVWIFLYAHKKNKIVYRWEVGKIHCYMFRNRTDKANVQLKPQTVKHSRGAYKRMAIFELFFFRSHFSFDFFSSVDKRIVSIMNFKENSLFYKIIKGKLCGEGFSRKKLLFQNDILSETGLFIGRFCGTTVDFSVNWLEPPKVLGT